MSIFDTAAQTLNTFFIYMINRVPWPHYQLKKCIVCVSLFYVIDTGSISNKAPGPDPRGNRAGGYLSPSTISSDAGYADLPLPLLGAPVSIEALVKLGCVLIVYF